MGSAGAGEPGFNKVEKERRNLTLVIIRLSGDLGMEDPSGARQAEATQRLAREGGSGMEAVAVDRRK